MIPFEDLVAALERYKARKAATSGPAPNQPASRAVSGKQAQQAQRQVSSLDLGDDLLSEE
jgi:hypothetical protein